jgi:hypothetical protein
VTVVFESQLPLDVPGMGNLEARREALHRYLETINLKPAPGSDVQEAAPGRGRVLVGELEPSLGLAGIRRETIVDRPGVTYLRRSWEGGHHYFIANHGEKPVDGWLPLTVTAASIALMDPMTGRVGVARTRASQPQGTEVYLQLEPGASLILRTFADRRVQGPQWRDSGPAGPPVPLTGTWRVTFLQGGPQRPGDFEATTLASWTTRDDLEARRFAGTARYTLAFDAPTGPAARWRLDLGQVCHSARARLNGRDLGTRFARPFALDIEGLAPTGNVLEIEVTNLSANRIRDLDRRGVNWKIFQDINFVNIQYRPFDASDWPLSDSGLLGPVTLTPLAGIEP